MENEIIAKYIIKRIELEKIVSDNSSPDEQFWNELEQIEKQLIELGIDPDKLFNEYLQQNNSSEQAQELPSQISTPYTRIERRYRPVLLTDTGVIYRGEMTGETADGQMAHQDEQNPVVAACGKVISVERVYGRCDACGLYECSQEHLFFCHCQGCLTRTLCFRDVYFLETEPGRILPFCKIHYYENLKTLDTWKFM